MRMWMVDPSKMCRKHLLGEHVETHMFLGTLRKKKSIKGYISNNLLEPLSLQQRHDALVAEMTRRNMRHNTPLTIDDELDYLSNSELNFRINRESSELELKNRCFNCKF